MIKRITTRSLANALKHTLVNPREKWEQDRRKKLIPEHLMLQTRQLIKIHALINCSITAGITYFNNIKNYIPTAETSIPTGAVGSQ